MAEPVLVAGGSIAALVAADALAGSGRAVRLRLPQRGVGSGFLPITIGERRLELGPRLIELAYDDAPGEAPPLRDYVPGPHGHRPYLAIIDRFVTELAGADLRPVRRPELQRDGRRVDDFLLGGDLETLPALLPDDLATIGAQARIASQREGDAGLLAPAREPELWSRSLADASVTNHGAVFHARVIEAIAEKILPGGSASVIAALRRRIWLPLFHPRTLAEAAAGSLTYRPQRPMHTIDGGGMGVLVSRLLERIQRNPRATVVASGPLTKMARDGDRAVLSFEDGAVELTSATIVGASAEELFRAAGVAYTPERVRLPIVWVDIDRHEIRDPPSALFVADESSPVYRVSESMAITDPRRCTLAVELRHDIEETSLATTALTALRALDIVRDSASVVHAAAVPAFTTPSHAELDRFAKARAEFELLGLPVRVVGGGAGFSCDSFNEQVVQGLLAAELNG